MAALSIDWQEWTALALVAGAAVMLVRSFILRSRQHRCDQCALMESKRGSVKR